MSERSPRTDLSAGAYLVELLRNWHDYEARNRVRSRQIKDMPDFDVAGDVSQHLTAEDAEELSNNPFRRILVLPRIIDLADSFNPNTSDGRFMRWKIRAVSARVQAQEGRGYDFDDYIQETLALEKNSDVTPSLVPEEEVETQRKLVQARYAEVSHDFTRGGFDQFLEEHRLDRLKQEDIKAEFRNWADELVPIMQKALGIDWAPAYEMEFVKEEEYWINWTSGDASGYKYKVNTDERPLRRLYRGSPPRLITHEVLTHLFQVESWRRNIEAGLINPGYGATTVPGPEQPHNEGLANSITLYIPELYEKIGPFGRLAVDQTLYEDMVLRNFHIMVNTADLRDARQMEEARQYLLDSLPSQREEDFKTIVRERTIDPRDRSYLLCYGYSFEHCQYAKRLAPADQPQPKLPFQRVPESVDKRIDFIRFSFQQPATMLQVHNYVAVLENEKQKQEAERRTPDHWYNPIIEAAHDFIDKVRTGRVYSIHGTGEPAKRAS